MIKNSPKREERKKEIVNFIKNNPLATHRTLRENLKLNPHKYFKSLEEAFGLAGVKVPRTFKIKNLEERRKIVIEYIRKHPLTGGQTIAKDTKINPGNAFKNIEEAFEAAGVRYPRKIDKRKKEEKRQQIIKLVQENPLVSIEEIMKRVKTQPYKIFSGIKEIYKEAGISPIKKKEKWRLKKQKEVIEYIKRNPLATQREINMACRTHVQVTFNKGIFEAYERAEVDFPYERLKLYGVGVKTIRDRAKNFENEIAIKLSGYGKINRLVKTKRGFADIILERKEKKAVIEVKNYQNKEISISQINQLNKYLEDCGCNLGFLICNNKPKKDTFLINENKIFVLADKELEKIPLLMQAP